ncbi:PREDICTED: galectin-3-binding protein [Elephantulus edwardii]|uniref:galectin-3-binding protein n=1 Tax=Elephantulus edwardii TaxID=28737 RepID=UPI0003F08360|nr:PREDICTED: galectin-3-binding protein [Elephantulus edwardii]
MPQRAAFTYTELVRTGLVAPERQQDAPPHSKDNTIVRSNITPLGASPLDGRRALRGFATLSHAAGHRPSSTQPATALEDQASGSMALSLLLWTCLLVAESHGLEDGDMRLVDGDAPNKGRVEIFYRGQWGTVCDNGWDLVDASVVCRALGFQNATQALDNAAFGPGSGPVMLSEVRCAGTELSLADCKSPGWMQSACQHRDDAGVVCANETISEPVHTLDLSGELEQALHGIFDSQQGCDLSIRVQAGGEEALSMCAHTLILSTNPEAQALLRGPGGTVTMEVEAECVPVVTDFIGYLYSRRLDVTSSTVKCFHQLASTYEAPWLRDYCARLFTTLLPQDPSFRTPLQLHAYALTTHDALLESLCVRFLAWNFEALTQTDAWATVPLPLLRTLLSSSELAVSSELALLKAIDAWSQGASASHAELGALLEEVRFPMIPPSELFQLQFNVSLLQAHEALLHRQMLQALEFHTVPCGLLAQHRALNLTQPAFQPRRLYTSPTWSGSLRNNLSGSRRSNYPYEYNTRSYYSQSFKTPQHPSFLFQSTRLSWSLFLLPTVQSCWNYGFSCSASDVPALGLTRSGYPDSAIRYENKALMLCSSGLAVAVTDFEGQKAPLPRALSVNGSRDAPLFPCPQGSFSSFRAVIRPVYLTNSSSVQ